MNPTTQEREELEALSMDLFGSSSKWQTLLKKGYPELLTVENETQEVDANGISSTKKVNTPVMLGKTQVSTLKHHTIESLQNMLRGMKASKDQFVAAQKKAQEEEKAKKDLEAVARHVQAVAGGSVRLSE